MSIETFENGSVLYTGDDLYKAFERSQDVRNKHEVSCDFCHYEEESEQCDGCSIKDDLSCSCHLNPPCSKCVNSRFEPTKFLINYRNYTSKNRSRWETFPTTEDVFNKFNEIEKKQFTMSAEILTTGEIAIYLETFNDEDIRNVLDVCEKVKFKTVAQEMIRKFKIT